MKALSIKNPWADLISSGKKTIETRMWKTSHRGDLLICVTQSPPSENSGLAICVVDLYDVQPMTKDHEALALYKSEPGRYSWFLRNLRPIVPVPIRSALGIFEAEINPRLHFPSTMY